MPEDEESDGCIVMLAYVYSCLAVGIALLCLCRLSLYIGMKFECVASPMNQYLKQYHGEPMVKSYRLMPEVER